MLYMLFFPICQDFGLNLLYKPLSGKPRFFSDHRKSSRRTGFATPSAMFADDRTLSSLEKPRRTGFATPSAMFADDRTLSSLPDGVCNPVRNVCR